MPPLSPDLKGKPLRKQTWMCADFATGIQESLPSIFATQRPASRSCLPPIPEPACSPLLVENKTKRRLLLGPGEDDDDEEALLLPERQSCRRQSSSMKTGRYFLNFLYSSSGADPFTVSGKPIETFYRKATYAQHPELHLFKEKIRATCINRLTDCPSTEQRVQRRSRFKSIFRYFQIFRHIV